MFLNLLIVYCQFKVIYDNQTMADFKFLCKSEYEKPALKLDLLKLIVFIRNGDRSPDKGKNDGWKKKMCINCRSKECSLVHCKNGMLTVKGYKQGYDLGSFIKSEYYPRFYKKNIEYINNRDHVLFDYDKKTDDDHIGLPKTSNANKNMTENLKTGNEKVYFDLDHYRKSQSNKPQSPDIKINGYYYNTKKSYVFLKSVLDSLDYSDLKTRKIDSLECSSQCLDLRNSLFSKNDSERLVSGAEFDKIITSFCNDVPIDCSKFECDLMKMNDYLVQEKLNFEDNLAKMKEDIVSVAIDFGNLSQFLLSIMKNEDISIVSATSETIISLLVGLNTQNDDLIPYAGAVFIELLRDKTGNEFYSVVYNKKRMEFGMFKEKYVEKKEFERFLNMFALNSNKITEICKYSMKSFDKNELLEFKKQKLKDIFDPLVQKLHEKRLLIK